jgi:hypothetical protein
MSRSALRSGAALLACGLALGACVSPGPKPPPAPPAVAAAPPPLQAPPPPPPTMVVKTPAPVKVACVPKTLPKAPKYPDTDAALRDAGGAADRYQLMAAGRLLRDRRLAELEKVVEGCR